MANAHHSRFWQRARLILRALGCILMAWAAWGFTPRAAPNPESQPALRVLLVDASASAQRCQRSWLSWVRGALDQEAQQAALLGEQLAIIGFASDVGLQFGPGDPLECQERLRGSLGEPLDPRAGAGDQGASQLTQALQLAATLCLQPGRLPGAVLLMGCDGYTGSVPTNEIARLRKAGARVELRPAPAPYWHELNLKELRIEPRLEVGAPILTLAVLEYLPGSAPLEDAYLEVEVRHAAGVQNQRIELSLPPFGGSLQVPIACGPAGPGRTEIEVQLRMLPGPGDPVPENDRLRGSTTAAGASVILVAARPAQMAAARAWLAASGESSLPGIQFVFVDPKSVPLALQDADALITFDVPLYQLPSASIEAFVQSGGGLFVTSGAQFLGDWATGMSTDGLAQLMPAQPKAQDAEPRDVVLMVDGSGSMSGEPFETVRAACLDLVGHADPADRVVLRFFTVSLQEEHVIKERTQAGQRPAQRGQQAARRLLELHVPTGSTHILESIERFARQAAGQARETLLFVLTDGFERDSAFQLEQRVEALHALLIQARVRIIPVAIGAKYDLEFMRLLARPGQTVARPEGLDALRDLFRREVSSSRCREASALTLEWAPAEAGGLAADLRGASAIKLQSIQRFVLNELKPWAEALWLADEGEPVLAAGRVGLGRVALLASLPGEGWAAGWLGQAGMGQPAEFEHLLRWLARGTGERSASIELHQVGRHLELRGLDSGWPAAFEASVVDAIAASQVEFERIGFAPLERGGSGHFIQRRRGRLHSASQVLAAGAPVLRLEQPSGEVLFLPLDTPRPLEFSEHMPLDLQWLEAPESTPKMGSQALKWATSPWAPHLLALGLVALFLGFVRLGR